MTLRTGDVEYLIEGGYGPRYVPTGQILFARSGALWAVPFDVDRLEVTGREVPVLEGVQANRVIGGVAYAVSDEGTLAYIPGAEESGSWNLLLVDRQGREEPTRQPAHWLDRLPPESKKFGRRSQLKNWRPEGGMSVYTNALASMAIPLK